MIRILWQTLVLAKEELRDLLTRRRVVLTLAVYLLLLATTLYALVRLQQRIAQFTGGVSGFRMDSPELQEILKKFQVPELTTVLTFLQGVPSAWWVFQLLALFLIPTIVSFTSCDMISIDLYRGTIRMIVARTSRIAYCMGKLLAHAVLLGVLQVVAMATLVGLCLTFVPSVSIATHLKAALQYAVILLPYIVLVVTATGFMSCICRKPFTALLAINFLWAVASVLMFLWPEISPLQMRALVGVLAPIPEFAWYSAAWHLGWSLLFAVLSVVIVVRRDV